MTEAKNATSHLVQLEDITLTLSSDAGPVEILRGIDLTIDSSQSLGIVGPSGSGKSTLMMVLAGLEQPSSGTVTCQGRVLTEMDEDELAVFRRDHIGIVFQSFHLIPTMNALENVAVPLEFAGHEDAFTRAEKELAHVGLADRLQHYPSQLSGGEQQRVALARALAPRPQLLLADEPTGNLDSSTGERVVELIFRLHEERGMTLVMITHDKGLAAKCDRVVSMADGKIVSDHAGERARSAPADLPEMQLAD